MVIGVLFPIFLGASLTLITAWCLGRLLLRGMRVKLCRLEEDLFALLAGSACLSVLVFVLCSLGWARKGVFVALFVASAGIALWRGALRPATERLRSVPLLSLLLFLAPFAVYAILYFVNAAAPEASPDGSTHNLGGVVIWWRYRGFVRDTSSIYASLPQALEMLYLFAFAFGKHSAATLVHFAFLCALPWMMFCYGRRFAMVQPSVLGAMLIFLSPVVGVAGISAYHDLALASTLFGLFYILQIWDQNPNQRPLPLAGLLAGFGFALEYTGALGILYCIGFVSWRLLREKRSVWRPMAILIGWTAIPTVPWIAKNWWLMGSPLPLWPGIHTIAPVRQLPLLWSFGGASVGGLFGPWLLLTPLALVASRWQQGRRLLFAAGLFGLAALQNSATRMLLPFAVFAAPALGLAVERSPGILPALLLLHSLISWPRAVAAYSDTYAWRLSGMPLRAAKRSNPEDQYLRSRLGLYGMARAIDQTTPASARIITLIQIPQAYTTRRLWYVAESDKARLALDSIQAAALPGAYPKWEIRFHLREQPVQALRVVASEKANHPWSVTELRLYRAGVEIPRQPSWRISAKPNLLESPRAVDNSEVTAWSTLRAAEPGMFLEFNFPEAVQPDRVGIVCGRDSAPGKLRVDGLIGTSGWQTLGDQPEIIERVPPSGLRRAAIAEAKLLGFDYLIARQDTASGFDLRRNTFFWGITLITETGGVCLFHLD